MASCKEKDVKNLKSKLDGEKLDLSMSELSVVPVREIAALKKVTDLDLSSNQITSLPDDFCTLKNLVKLDLSSNKLRSLPEQFGKLENLQHLDLYKNSLETLPISFVHLKQLRWLDVKDNPLDADLRKVAGDCLEAKQCKEAATKVVQHMQKLNADRDRERQKDLKKQREVEAAERSKEEETKSAKAADKKKEKDRKKEATKNVREPEKNNENEKESKKDAETKRAAQRERDAARQEKRKAKKGRGFFGCIGCLFSSFFCLLFVIALVASGLAAVLYFNCSRASGKEFIPKSRDLCQDIYQMIQTGRIAPLTWDYKASIRESGVALQGFSSNALESIRKFDYVAWKNGIIETALTCRDTIVEFSIWTYDNAKPILKQTAEWVWITIGLVLWALERAFHYAVRIGQYTIEAGTDVVNNFPAYWEKMKIYWKNLK